MQLVRSSTPAQYELHDDSDGEGSTFFAELGAIWTEALLSVELSRDERESWVEKIEGWADDLSAYGIDEAFGPAVGAAESGWDNASLQRAMAGEITGFGAWADEESPWYAGELAVARLNVLERQGRTDEYLNLAQAESQFRLYATMLVKLGRVEEAVTAGRQFLTTAEDLFTLAQHLREHGDAEQALTIAELGLGRDGQPAALAIWTRDLASGLGHSDRALAAARIAFHVAPDLAGYLAVKELADADWAVERNALLTDLRNISTYRIAGPIEVYLHEGLIDDAIRTVDDHPYSYDLIRKVADAAIASHPDWVIRTGKDQAETIMDGGKSEAYHHAADWLAKAKRAYQLSGRAAEWRTYLEGLIALHHRKYRLRPMLEALRR